VTYPRRDAGALLFARYAYPPNALGYCGPSDAELFLGVASEGKDTTGLRHLAAQFDGAWPYLELIAACNGIADPLDARVVQAYWTGNPLATRVSPQMLRAALRDRFEHRAGSSRDDLLAAAVGGIAQHSFHVFAVYPWLGLLRTGMQGPPLEVLDRCRIRWGTVDDVAGDVVTVRAQALYFDGTRLCLGPPRTEQVRRGEDGVRLTGDVRAGDVVSLHWDWVCDRLSTTALGWLRYCTERNLATVNALARPGPAVACDR
jgi:hypothetical protein